MAGGRYEHPNDTMLHHALVVSLPELSTELALLGQVDIVLLLYAGALSPTLSGFQNLI
jgi:hypothetical protein